MTSKKKRKTKAARDYKTKTNITVSYTAVKAEFVLTNLKESNGVLKSLIKHSRLWVRKERVVDQDSTV